MKKILVFLLAGFLSFSCEENEKRIDVINMDFSEYYTYQDLKEKGTDKPAFPFENSQGATEVKSILLSKLKNTQLYMKLGESNSNNRYSYALLVNEFGNVDKILIQRSMGEELDKIIVDEAAGWKFKPASINGKEVKFKYEIEFDGTDYFVSVEQMPEPIGGILAISKLVEYPEAAKKAGIQGKVFVKAFINESGIVDSVGLLKGIGSGCDESAMDAVKKVKFHPAVDNGIVVKSQVVIPIYFKLQ